jgi:hypothetical protein
MFESFTERLIVAFVSAVAATLTLAIYPLALIILGGGAGGGGEFELGAHFYSFIFSKFGLAVIVGASIVGFFTGAERMANIFSFFWGTHNFWSRFNEYLHDKSENLQTEHSVSNWVLGLLLVTFAVFMVVRYA